MLNFAQLSRLDLNLLVLFDIVLEEGHVARAAARLNLTPSAVSHGLGRLRRLLNDPLFLRRPKGVVPTARALELAEPIRDMLARVDRIVASASPFDPATARRRFTIGAPDGASAVVLAPLLELLNRTAPGIDIGLRLLMPELRDRLSDQAWHGALAGLEAREVDVAVLPIGTVPPRFVARKLYEEDFVVAMRKGHPCARKPSLMQFCAMRHLLVSLSGDAHGFVDVLLAERGLSRRVVLTVPSFMMALSHLAESDLIAALPRQLMARYGARFGLVAAELPLRRRSDTLSAVITKAAMMDAGIAWLLQILAERVAPELARPGRGRLRAAGIVSSPIG
jgi:DNA-binding transcriptional LysR family regulator